MIGSKSSTRFLFLQTLIVSAPTSPQRMDTTSRVGLEPPPDKEAMSFNTWVVASTVTSKGQPSIFVKQIEKILEIPIHGTK